MKHLAIALVAIPLAACGTSLAPRGTTHAEVDGMICGQPFKASVADGKERASFRASARCADGSTVEVVSGESSAFAGQQAADQQNALILGIVERLLGAVQP